MKVRKLTCTKDRKNQEASWFYFSLFGLRGFLTNYKR